MKKSLDTSDWSLVISLFLIICSIVIVAKIKAIRATALVLDAELKPKSVVVRVEGAVKKPGEFHVAPGTLVQDVIKKAKPRRFADIQKLPLLAPIDGSMTICLEKMREISVRVCGEAEEVQLRLPWGSRLSDLRSKLSLTKEADISFFKGRRLLKEGEVIEVPKKPIE